MEPTENELLIRFRIDGILRDMLILLKNIHPLIVARIKIMADLKIDEHRLPQDGRITMRVNELPISLRVSIIPPSQGEKVVIRILDESARELSLKDIGFRGKELDAVNDIIKTPDGMILVTGPTGSGKTTTLYTIMKILNKPEVNINTIEDPVEYNMPRINQTQVNPAIGLTFANGLRSLLRQDPDIIMVGEIRDEETANMAIHSAMTGHLVLSTLHTNDAPGAIPRFLDMGSEPFLLASTLKLAIAQRLVRRLSPESRVEVKMGKAEAKAIGEQLKELGFGKEVIDEWTSIPLFKVDPSIGRLNSGFKGRVGIFEMLEVTDTVREMILEKTPGHELRAEMIRQGHMPMFLFGLELVKQGITTFEEIMRVAQE
jgi:type IV pilus assembly protein PilB